jgi:hypothetical protein
VALFTVMLMLLGLSSFSVSGKDNSGKKESRGKYYVSVTDQGVKLTVGTHLADLVKTTSLLPIQVSVINKSGKRLEVDFENFSLLNRNGDALDPATIQEVDTSRRSFEKGVQRFTKLEAQIGTMNPKLFTNFYPRNKSIAYRSVTLPSNYKMVDTIYFKDTTLKGSYTLVMENKNFDEPIAIDIEISG